MKSVYFGIKYHPDNSNRDVIEAFEKCFSKHGYESYCVARDLEQWGAASFSAQDIMQDTFAKIDASDLVVVDVTEKGIGLGIEAGYAKAKGKALIIVARDSVEVSTTIKGIADQIIFFNNISEIEF
ncbi:nucleoside 2-deoxyribosyltransferase [Endozoicomonadaceae bacterium StTr2]